MLCRSYAKVGGCAAQASPPFLHKMHLRTIKSMQLRAPPHSALKKIARVFLQKGAATQPRSPPSGQNVFDAENTQCLWLCNSYWPMFHGTCLIQKLRSSDAAF